MEASTVLEGTLPPEQQPAHLVVKEQKLAAPPRARQTVTQQETLWALLLAMRLGVAPSMGLSTLTTMQAHVLVPVVVLTIRKFSVPIVQLISMTAE